MHPQLSPMNLCILRTKVSDGHGPVLKQTVHLTISLFSSAVTKCLELNVYKEGGDFCLVILGKTLW